MHRSMFHRLQVILAVLFVFTGLAAGQSTLSVVPRELALVAPVPAPGSAPAAPAKSTLTVSSPTPNVPFNAVVRFLGSAGTSWLTVTPDSGVTPATLTVS